MQAPQSPVVWWLFKIVSQSSCSSTPPDMLASPSRSLRHNSSSWRIGTGSSCCVRQCWYCGSRMIRIIMHSYPLFSISQQLALSWREPGGVNPPHLSNEKSGSSSLHQQQESKGGEATLLHPLLIWPCALVSSTERFTDGNFKNPML